MAALPFPYRIPTNKRARPGVEAVAAETGHGIPRSYVRTTSPVKTWRVKRNDPSKLSVAWESGKRVLPFTFLIPWEASVSQAADAGGLYPGDERGLTAV